MRRLTVRDLNRALLDRQGLLKRSRVSAVDMVDRILALQAQEPASPYLALWNRIEGFRADELAADFAARRIVKASLMRITLHAVRVDDHAALHDAMQPVLRRARLGDARFTDTGLTADEGLALSDRLVAFADGPTTKQQMLDELAGVDPRAPAAWWALRTFSRLLHSPTDAPWSFGHHPVYEAAPARPSAGFDASLRELITRHMRAFGPARPQDIARFSLHRVSTIRAAIDDMADVLVRHDGPDGRPRFDLVDARPIPDPDTPAPPRLMAMWDSVLFAHADRTVVISDEHRRQVIRRNGDTLASVLVDGRVAGVWRAVEAGIEVTPFDVWTDDTWQALAAEAVALGRFLAPREPLVYHRYQRWWERLPHDRRRLLPY